MAVSKAWFGDRAGTDGPTFKRGDYVKFPDPYNGPKAEPVYATIEKVNHDTGLVRWDDPETHDARDKWIPFDEMSKA
jgi:hypothetical protein